MRKCADCIETDGKPFFLKGMGLDVCPVWQCVEKHEWSTAETVANS
ncbi:MAG: hypothetical protein FGF52_04300 [Candidatus Brockarchaeota archaeon]|nr:hypothetical protein [Candidatus Brockarchaeota archaeon]